MSLENFGTTRIKYYSPQFICLSLVVLIFLFFTFNAQMNMENRGIDFGFSFCDDLDNKPLWASLAHTDVGFMTNQFDPVADPKLLLVTMSDELKRYRNSIDINKLFLGSKDQGSIAYWYFNLPKYLKLLFETFNMALLATIVGSALALFLSFLAATSFRLKLYSTSSMDIPDFSLMISR